jgi:hypothetical protein
MGETASYLGYNFISETTELISMKYGICGLH